MLCYAMLCSAGITYMLHHELCKWWGTVAFRKWWGTVALAYSSVAFARPLRAQFFSDFSGATLNPGQLRNQIFEAVPSSLPGILSAGAFFCLCKANANANAKARFFRNRFGLKVGAMVPWPAALR